MLRTVCRRKAQQHRRTLVPRRERRGEKRPQRPVHEVTRAAIGDGGGRTQQIAIDHDNLIGGLAFQRLNGIELQRLRGWMGQHRTDGRAAAGFSDKDTTGLHRSSLKRLAEGEIDVRVDVHGLRGVGRDGAYNFRKGFVENEIAEIECLPVAGERGGPPGDATKVRGDGFDIEGSHGNQRDTESSVAASPHIGASGQSALRGEGEENIDTRHDGRRVRPHQPSGDRAAGREDQILSNGKPIRDQR